MLGPSFSEGVHTVSLNDMPLLSSTTIDSGYPRYYRWATAPGKILAARQLPLRGHSPCQAHYHRSEGRKKPRVQAVAQPAKGEAKGSKSLGSVESEDVDDGTCDVFVGPDGEIMEVMCCDYGFRSGFGRLYQGEDGEIPKNIFQLAWDNFKKESQQIRRSFRFNEYAQISEANPPNNPVAKAVNWTGSKFVGGLSSIDEALENAEVLGKLEAEDPLDEGNLTRDCREVQAALRDFQLDNAAVWVKEKERRSLPEHTPAPWFIKAPYLALCWVLDAIYDKRPIQRFWFLETVARMPYFAYISMLHLYESLGWWRAGAELRRVHFAEEWNELHHLQIMESLGGDQFWIDRFMAQHAAVFYYWVLVAMFAFVPNLSYLFSELVEGHAVDTYDVFVESNRDRLQKLPPPLVALKYYKGGDLYYFDYLQTKGGEPRRPECRNLYDVFVNIRDDEKEHVKTMTACRDYSIVGDLVNKGQAEKRIRAKGKLSPPSDEASIKTMDRTHLT